MAEYGIEKIKTIGDSYMCVGGLPVPRSNHAVDTVRAALAIQEWMRQYSESRRLAGRSYFEIRIGLHSGPLVSGVVGTRKFAYDIWGETVNMAARMESSGMAGRVNISGATQERIKNHFTCTYRGRLPAKNIGDIDMYFVDAEKQPDA
jgi:class 3 adenylate cyclase